MSKDLIPVPIKNDDGTTTEINIILKKQNFQRDVDSANGSVFC